MLRPLIALSLIVVAGTAAAQGPDISRDFVLTDKDAVGVLSPRVVCNAMTSRLLWSTDGNTLLALRTDNAPAEEMALAMLRTNPKEIDVNALQLPKQELVFYNAKANKVRAVVPLGDPMNQIQQVEWLPGTQQVMVVYYRSLGQGQGGPPQLAQELALVSADGKVNPLLETETEKAAVFVTASPTKALVAALTEPEPIPQPGKERTVRLQVFNSAGKAVVDTTLSQTAFASPMWGADGKLYVISRELDRIHNNVKTTYRPMDLTNGKLGDAVSGLPLVPGPSSSKLDIRTDRLNLPLGKKFPAEMVQALTLVSTGKHDPDEFAVVSSDAQMSALAPNGEYIAYTSRGITAVRPIARVPRDLFLKARDQAARAIVLNQAKQVGLAFIMYANDNDDNLPVTGADWQGMVGPYVKNNDMFNGFTYTFGGGSVVDVQSPASTELGRISGPGGMAVVYIDGHAKWIPNP